MVVARHETVRWQPVDWLVLRGSAGTTFRGPQANQVASNQITSLAGIQAAANNFKSVDIFGNPNDLGPETAFTYNVGAVVSTSGFTASVDYWSFDFNDRITTTPTGQRYPRKHPLPWHPLFLVAWFGCVATCVQPTMLPFIRP